MPVSLLQGPGDIIDERMENKRAGDGKEGSEMLYSGLDMAVTLRTHCN